MPDITAEYRIIETGAGLVDRSRPGRVRLEGADARALLQNLVTNDLSALDESRGVYACLLTPQGRMVTDFRLFEREGAIVGGVAPGMAAAIAAKLDALVFAEDVRVSDVTNETSVLTVAGEGAGAAIAEALPVARETLDVLPALGQVRVSSRVWIVRADETERPMFDVWLPAAGRDDMMQRLTAGGAVPVSGDLIELLRIEAGRPAFGVDMTSETIPLEAGLLDRAISTTKGCYVGQEVIIRVLHRGGGRVARRLVRLKVGGTGPGEPPLQPARIVLNNKEIGRVTSAAWSPKSGHAVALGYVARDHANVGATVEIEIAPGTRPAEIIGLAG